MYFFRPELSYFSFFETRSLQSLWSCYFNTLSHTTKRIYNLSTFGYVHINHIKNISAPNRANKICFRVDQIQVYLDCNQKSERAVNPCRLGLRGRREVWVYSLANAGTKPIAECEGSARDWLLGGTSRDKCQAACGSS
jgi:hypothetical protein